MDCKQYHENVQILYKVVKDLVEAYDVAMTHFGNVSPAAQEDIWKIFRESRSQALEFLDQLENE